MAYVTVPKDLTRVKSKVVLGLTKRQLICFGGALLVGVPLFLLIRGRVPTSAAALIMVFAMLPGFLLALYERHGQPLEVVVWQIIQCSFIQPKERPYQTNNAYSALVRQHQMGEALPDQQRLLCPCAAAPNGQGGKCDCPKSKSKRRRQRRR